MTIYFDMTIIALLAIYFIAALLCLTDDGSGKRKHLAASLLFWPFLPLINRRLARALTSREILGFGFLLLFMLLVIVFSIMRVIK